MAAGTSTILEQIVGDGRKAVLLRGPAGCGKTDLAIRAYQAYRDAQGNPQAILLAPNAPAVSALRKRLLRQSPTGVVVAPKVMTFASLAGLVLGSRARRLTPLSRQLLLRRIVNDLAQAGGLSVLAGVADTPGLAASLDTAIAELKRSAVDPAVLARVAGRGPGKAADLVAVYKAYQDHLLARGLYDLEGQMWQAREDLAALPADAPLPAGLAGVRAVIADGFTDFTPTQLSILALLGGRIERVVLTLTHADDGRAKLWHWTRRALNQIRGAFGADLAQIDLPAQTSSPLAGVWEGVFRMDRPVQAPPPGLSILAAAGIDAEVSTVARRVKALLQHGAASGDIAVLARSMDAYRPIIERVFASCGLPVRGVGVCLGNVPCVRLLLDLAELGPRFNSRNVLAILRNSYFRADRLGEYSGETLLAAETIIREGNVVEGAEAYQNAAERLARRAQAGVADEEADGPPPTRTIAPEQYLRAAELFTKLFDLAAAVAPADLPALAEKLGLEHAIIQLGDAELIARDLQALAQLTATTADLGETAPTLAEFRAALSAVTLPAPGGPSLVDVLDVLDARAIRYRHVFLLGLGEGQFPQRLSEGSLLGEPQRQAWAARGITLDSRSDLSAREMLLFYLAVSRADDSLTLSYLQSDTSGKPAAPSTFLAGLLDLLGGPAAVPTETIAPGQFLPPREHIACPRDALLAAVADLFDAQAAVTPGLLGHVAQTQPAALRQLACGIWARHRRWRRDSCDIYDGRLASPDLLAGLAQRFGPPCVFSASQLNRFGQCPWQFFAHYVLGLRALVQPKRLLEPVDRGRFIHNVLFQTYQSLQQELGGAVDLSAVAEPCLLEHLDAALAAQARRVESRRPPYPVLWEIQKRQMRQDLETYLRTARGEDRLRACGLAFELGFGEPPRGEIHSPLSVPEPVTLDTPAGPVRFKGRIDRVDHVATEEAGDGLFVVDYKTSGLPTAADMLAGRSVQLALYAAAAEKLLDRPALGGVFHRIGGKGGARLLAAVQAPRGNCSAYTPNPNYEQQRADVWDAIARSIESMRRGRFDLHPTGRTCPSWCEFRQVCHFSPTRAQIKNGEAADA